MKTKLLKKFRKQVLRKYKPVHLKDGWAIKYHTYSVEVWDQNCEYTHYAYRGCKTKKEAIARLFKMEGYYEMLKLIKEYKTK